MGEPPEQSPADAAHNERIDDEVLVKRFHQGDDNAFDRIVERYSGEVSGLANRLLGWGGDVEDVVQNVFLAAFVGLKRFRFDCSLKTWLFTITINKCRTWRYRAALRQRFFSKAAGSVSLSEAAAADKGASERERFDRVLQAVRALPTKYREPIVLRYLQELGANEVSRILGISKNVLEVRLSRARRRLKEKLGGLIKE